MTKKTILFAALCAIASSAVSAQDTDDFMVKYQPEGYSLVWNDEFDSEQFNPENWEYCARQTSTWNKRNSTQPQLYRIEEGALVLRAMANEEPDSDDPEFITGALQTKNQFAFTYGIVEARIKTVPHKGNFPAFWMMPLVNEAGWPNGGEIDIWEQINNDNYNYHTLHGYWTNISGGKSSTSNYNPAQYHVYSLKWEPEKLTWLVDGNVVHTVRKNPADTNEHAWPFTEHFYIIIDQAVGDNNSWPQPYDPDFVYATYFDWVRVYQTEEQSNTLSGVREINSYAQSLKPSGIFDISGRKVNASSIEALPKGLYIVDGKKIVR